MSSKLMNLSLGAAMCLAMTSFSCMADSRSEWGTPFAGSKPIDDQALMQVSARGIDEAAVKHLQSGGKLGDYAAQSGNALLMAGAAAAESADKQAAQTQYKMAMSAAQAVTNTVQLTGVMTTITPVPTFVPVMGAPLFGLPFLPPKTSNDR